MKITLKKKKILFICEREREEERENEHEEGQREREADSPLSRKPDTELNPRTQRP